MWFVVFFRAQLTAEAGREQNEGAGPRRKLGG